MGHGHPGRIAPRALQPVYQLLLAYSNVAIPIDVLKTLFSPEGLYLYEHNINISWSAILLMVKALGDRATPISIGRCLLRDRHTVSELLDKMESDGLVKKIRDLDRKNRTHTERSQDLREIMSRDRFPKFLQYFHKRPYNTRSDFDSECFVSATLTRNNWTSPGQTGLSRRNSSTPEGPICLL
jgi:hypothetical protein